MYQLDPYTRVMAAMVSTELQWVSVILVEQVVNINFQWPRHSVQEQ